MPWRSSMPIAVPRHELIHAAIQRRERAFPWPKHGCERPDARMVNALGAQVVSLPVEQYPLTVVPVGWRGRLLAGLTGDPERSWSGRESYSAFLIGLSRVGCSRTLRASDTFE